MKIDPQGWTSVIAVGELHESDPVRVDAFGIAVLLVRTEGRILAVADRCTHQGAPLHRGVVKSVGSDPTVTCPVHGSVFSLADGRVHRGPATRAVQAFEARVNEGVVELRQLG
jgi:nitrite reductase/ring-hydroxylating ferredoxin subunit